MASLQEVADAAGVSRSVASRALSGDARARISAATRERVQRAAELLDYVPNHRAQALRFARSGAVGLIVPDVNNAVFAELLGGVQDRAREVSMSVLLSQIDPPPTGREQLRELVGAGRVDGILLQRREDFSATLVSATSPGSPPMTPRSAVTKGSARQWNRLGFRCDAPGFRGQVGRHAEEPTPCTA
jgi:LacI family transcriptional regulator